MFGVLPLKVDERHIPEYRIMHQGKDAPSSQEDHRYPFAGAANPRVRLGIVRVDSAATAAAGSDDGGDISRRRGKLLMT